MKLKLYIGIFLLAAALSHAQTNDLTALLQQGLFEEQANRNLDAAIANYQSLAGQFDKDRQLAATAVFRLGECYRAQGRTNEAATQYQRILHDFSEQQTLATLSRQDLAGMGVSSSEEGKAGLGSPSLSISTEARLLATQLSGIEKLKSDPEEQARAVLAIFPDEALKKMLLNLPKLQEQEARLKANPQLRYNELGDYRIAIGADAAEIERHGTNLMSDAQWELNKQNSWIAERVNFIVGIQKARLKVLEAANGGEVVTGTHDGATPVVTSDEDREIQGIQQMIQDSPDLINAQDFVSGTPLVKAADSGRLKVAAYLLDHGADINKSVSDVRLNGELAVAGQVTPLVAAVLSGNKAMTKFLIDHGANVNFRGKNGDTPLHLAAQKGFLAVVEVLLASHADVNAQNNNGITPLFSAVQGGQIKIVHTLVAAGANMNLKDDKGRTVLNYAINTSLEMIQALLDAGTNPNTEDADGRTPLSYVTERDPQIVKLLLAAKADPNFGTLDAPLLCAIYKNDAATAESLLRAGANPNARGRTTYEVTINGARYMGGGSTPPVTPLYLAVSLNQLPMVQLLLKFKADPNDSQTDSQSLLFSALDKPDIAKALLEEGASAEVARAPVSYRVDLHETLLQEAAGQNQAETVALLLRHGANPNEREDNGNSPLHYAVNGMADEKVFATLLDHKANPNVRNNFGQTPLGILKQHLQDSTSTPARFASVDGKDVHVKKLITLLHQRGALDNLPNWDRITVGRPGANFSMAVFYQNSNNWNHFTLLDAIFQVNKSGNASSLNFPDCAHIVITRPAADGATAKRIIVNLLNATNGIDFARDVPLQFGDVIEIPEREHTLAETPMFLTGRHVQELHDYFRSIAGEARLIVAGGQTTQVPLEPFHSPIGYTLQLGAARAALTSNSDLSRVKVTRHDPKTNKTNEWTLDCSNQNNQGTPEFWLRAGDVIEVPEKP